MKMIESIVDMIDEEIDGAEHYARCALKHKDDFPSAAAAFHHIATEELRHIDILHVEVKKIIAEHRSAHGEPPAAMLAVWDYVHKKMIERVEKVKGLLGEYN